jgi:hypothetical protein
MGFRFTYCFAQAALYNHPLIYLQIIRIGYVHKRCTMLALHVPHVMAIITKTFPEGCKQIYMWGAAGTSAAEYAALNKMSFKVWDDVCAAVNHVRGLGGMSDNKRRKQPWPTCSCRYVRVIAGGCSLGWFYRLVSFLQSIPHASVLSRLCCWVSHQSPC